jgi:hypothetical protein
VKDIGFVVAATPAKYVERLLKHLAIFMEGESR